MLAAAVQDLARATEFRVGFVVGGALAGTTVFVLAERHRHRETPIGGFLVAGGFAIAAALSSTLPLNVVVGIALLALGGFVAGRVQHAFGALVLAVPGAVALVIDLGSPRSTWVAPVTALVIVAACPLVADFDRRFARAGWPLAFFAVSAAGVYFTVPDTEHALVLLGVAIPMVFIGWPVVYASLGPGGAYAVVGALMWVAGFECRGRQASLVGAIGCLGLLVAEPLARVLSRGRDTVLTTVPARQWSIVPVGAIHLGLVYIASRVAGLRSSVTQATVLVAFELALTVVVLRAASVRTSR